MKASQNPKAARSWLLVPASKPELVHQAARSGADAVVIDLYELVAERHKADARSGLRSSIGRAGAGGAAVYVGLAADEIFTALADAVWPGVAGIVLWRSERAQQVIDAAALISSLERERGLDDGAVKIVAAIETAQGNHAAYEIATAGSRVSGITLGRADLVMDLRPEPSGEIHLMPYLMQRLVIIAGAAGVSPIGAWWRAPDRGLLATPDNTYEAARRGIAIGFKGAMCLRADQVEALNRGYSSARRSHPMSGAEA